MTLLKVIYIDGTMGGAGHSKHIVNNLSKEGKLIGESYIKWKEFEESFLEFYNLWSNVDETKYI